MSQRRKSPPLVAVRTVAASRRGAALVEGTNHNRHYQAGRAADQFRSPLIGTWHDGLRFRWEQ